MPEAENKTLTTQNKQTNAYPLGIRARLAMLIVGAISLVTLIGGSYLFTEQRRWLYEDVQRSASALLESLAVPCAISLATNDTESLDGFLTEFVRSSAGPFGVVTLKMLDHRGRLVAHAWPGREEQPGTQQFLARVHIPPEFVTSASQSQKPLWKKSKNKHNAPVMYVSMPAVSGLRWGTIVAKLDLRSVERRIALSQTALIGAGFGLTLTIAVALFLSLSFMVIGPVRVLARTASDLQTGDLSSRAKIESSDEFGQLASIFNNMASDLQSYTTSLEEKVRERSAEIEEKNHVLEDLNRRLQEAVKELERQALSDALTGIYNRRYFNEIITAETQRSERSEHPLTLLMIDVDHFKQFNDTHGHPAGDTVLIEVANLLNDNLRSTDVVARYGGEEFVALLLDTDREAGVAAAEKLRASIADHRFEGEETQPLGTLSISVGVASLPFDTDHAAALIRYADEALYQAKAEGRNRVALWSQPKEPTKPTLVTNS